jgi:uncharacterized membrane protein YfcA
VTLDLTLLVVLLIVLLASVLSGAASFGFGLISVPALLLVYDPVVVVTIGAVAGVFRAIVILADTWRHVAYRTVLMLTPSSVIGTVLGVALLRLLDADLIKLAASIIAIGFALVLVRSRLAIVPATPWLTVATGLLSGTLTTSVGMQGPPVVLLFTARQMTTTTFRGSIAAYFLVLNISGIISLLGRDALHQDALLIAILVSPVAVFGTWIGQRLVRRVSQATFRRFTLVLLMVTASVGAVSAVLALLP